MLTQPPFQHARSSKHYRHSFHPAATFLLSHSFEKKKTPGALASRLRSFWCHAERRARHSPHLLDILAVHCTMRRNSRTMRPNAHSLGFGCVDVSNPSTGDDAHEADHPSWRSSEVADKKDVEALRSQTRPTRTFWDFSRTRKARSAPENLNAADTLGSTMLSALSSLPPKQFDKTRVGGIEAAPGHPIPLDIRLACGL